MNICVKFIKRLIQHILKNYVNGLIKSCIAVTVTVTLTLLLSLVWSVGGQEIVTESLSNSEYDEQQEVSGLQGPELGSGEVALIKEGSGSNEQKIEELRNKIYY